MQLARDNNIDELMRRAPKIITRVMNATPTAGWEDRLPSWRSKTHRRGRLGWGEVHNKKGEVVRKKWAVPQLQRAALMKGMTVYMDVLGYPPVRAGKYTHTHNPDPPHIH